MIPYLLLLALVGAERLAELARSRRNVRWALERGGVEAGRAHFRAMTALHAAFLPACALEVWLLDRPFVPLLGIPMLALVAGAQVLRYSAIAALGPRWNVRVVALPDAPAVTKGPYRFIRHPNYVAVVVEMFAIPLVHTAWLTALVFSLLNLLMLAIRIRCEERTLARVSDYAGMAELPRFVPRAPRSGANR